MGPKPEDTFADATRDETRFLQGDYFSLLLEALAQEAALVLGLGEIPAQPRAHTMRELCTIAARRVDPAGARAADPGCGVAQWPNP